MYLKTILRLINKISLSASHAVSQTIQAHRSAHQCRITKPKVQSQPYLRSWDRVTGKSSLEFIYCVPNASVGAEETFTYSWQKII